MHNYILSKCRFLLSMFAAVAILSACDKIDENERYIPTQFTPARAILIEDYTGQKCVNCPLATNTLHSLAQYFGDSIISVAIHGGPFGYAEPKGLATKEAEAYYTTLGIQEQPNGVINHRGVTTPYAQWTAEVCKLIKTPTDATIKAQATVDGDDLKVEVSVSATTAHADAILKVWLIEDNIVGIQSLPAAWGGGTDKEYVHNHVYRAAINGIEGTPVELSSTPEKQSFSIALSSKYVRENLGVVAFVYTPTDGVLQVTKCNVN